MALLINKNRDGMFLKSSSVAFSVSLTAPRSSSFFCICLVLWETASKSPSAEWIKVH